MKPRILKLLIEDDKDLSLLEDTYGIKFYVSMTKTFNALLEQLMGDFDNITIRFPVAFLAASYRKIPQLFVRALTRRTTGFQIAIQKKGDFLILRAGYNLESNKFARRIWDDLQACNFTTVAEKDIPASYREQPFVLLNRYRKKGMRVKLVRYGGRWKFVRVETKTKTKTKTKHENTQN